VELKDVNIYRITHIENIPHILEHGITHCQSESRNGRYVNIGDVSLIDNRRTKTVVVDNGDLEFESSKTIVLGEYTPFYFGIRMPMLYVIQNGGNFVMKATRPDDIIYIVCSMKRVLSKNLEFYFTDGHATDMYTTFYEKSCINQLVAVVNWEAVRSHYWGGFENLDIKRMKQAEFLISGDVTPDTIFGFGCYSEKSKSVLLSYGIEAGMIKVIPKAYY